MPEYVQAQAEPNPVKTCLHCDCVWDEAERHDKDGRLWRVYRIWRLTLHSDWLEYPDTMAIMLADSGESGAA